MHFSVEKNSILKKISAVIVMITALVFFSFNVFADTPVQPLQVVTYSDTSTNVRISGTAERLHYNVDSFQVVFMNPPNNYGTACTPILVSFRFYNSSELPAYVGQAEFELTATNGTGAVNTIIYGYDQISTDLFVAESSYSTAEVGRIGIGASNDFAYYTGFVIPPKTSLYFSCIVYVNASAYGQNNTGATEDVNQVTLSSLNLYTNQLSFSADYPYHNQPIDFSPLFDYIDSGVQVDLTGILTAVDVVYRNHSTTLTYSNLNASNTLFSFNDNLNQSHNFRVMVTNPYLLSSNTSYYEINNDNVIFQYDDLLCVSEYVTYRFRNFINSSLASNALQGTLNWTNNLTLYNASPIGYKYEIINQDNCVVTAVNRSQIIFDYKLDTISTAGVVPIGGYYSFTIRIDMLFDRRQLANGITSYYINRIDTNYDNYIVLSYTPPTYTSVDYAVYATAGAQDYAQRLLLNDIKTTLNNLYNAYSQVNGLDDSSDISNDVADVSDSNHIIEESYYSANASAIQATGLSNYRFSNEQNNGIGKVADDFMLLWNALGSWNGVYVFSLTMALATFIMRHGGLFTIKRETSDKGGED